MSRKRSVYQIEFMHDFGKPIDVKIAYIGGGSLNWALGLMADLAHDTRLAAHVRLYDLDQASAQRNAAIGARYAAVSRGVPATYAVSPTLQDALQGADIVVISILPGQFSDMAQDIDIPARYGIPQAVGDTVGPGGFVRALRAIPQLVEIGKAIRDTAPDAFVCNLTNPMSALTGALYKAHPAIKCWGECHEVTKIRKQTAWIANRQDENARFSHRDVAVNVLGINHFTFVDAITLDGRDMMPAYRDFAATHRQSGWAQSESDDPEKSRYFGSRNLVAFDLLERFGIPAAAGDRHLAEFMPAADYLAGPARWGFALTPVSYRLKMQKARAAYAEALRTGAQTPQASRSDEALTDQIAALMGGGAFTSNVNLPNSGQLAGFPTGTIVETNARFSGSGIAAQAAGRLPAALENIMLDHAERQTALVEAVCAAQADALFALFRSDPLVRPLATDTARNLYNDMIAATANCLPEPLRGAA